MSLTDVKTDVGFVHRPQIIFIQRVVRFVTGSKLKPKLGF
jgi:hypothetical protein